MLVFVEDAAEAVASADIEARDLLRGGHRFGERAQGCRRTALPGSDRFDLHRNPVGSRTRPLILTWSSTRLAHTRWWGRQGRAGAGSVPARGQRQGGRAGAGGADGCDPGCGGNHLM